MPTRSASLTRIAVFYDGNFFFKVSNYYRFAHPKTARISIDGLHQFIRHQIATAEDQDLRRCQVVEAHFFRGRFSAKAADERQQLYHDRVFDDILMGEGVFTHYLPMRNGSEKGVDVLLALEAYDLALHKGFDVVVLITGDGDFVPLARKLNSLGTRVMVLGWDFSYLDHENQLQQTATSQHLLAEASYPLKMQELIEDPAHAENELIKNLFTEPVISTPEEPRPSTATSPVPRPEGSPTAPATDTPPTFDADYTYTGIIMNLRANFGFIRCEAFPKNMFFHPTALKDTTFDKLSEGQQLWFRVGTNDNGLLALDITTTEEPQPPATVEV